MSTPRFSLNGTPQPSPTPEHEREIEKLLESRYDALNLLFTQLEDRLRKMRPAVPVWVQFAINVDNDDNDYTWQLIGMEKHRGTWRLCHAYDEVHNPNGPHDVKPIVEAPVTSRILAAHVAMKLPDAIAKSKERLVPEVDGAIKALNTLCQRI